MRVLEEAYSDVPAENDKVWRFMDFTKFLSILETEELYFNRADRFQDPYEGTVTHATLSSWLESISELFVTSKDIMMNFVNMHPNKYLFRQIIDILEVPPTPYNFSHLESLPQLMMQFKREFPFSEVFDNFDSGLDSVTQSLIDYTGEMNRLLSEFQLSRKFSFINCWHLNEYESDAMWKLYLKSNEGVAIQTTYNRLKKSLIDKKHNEVIKIGKVNYIDYQSEEISIEKSLDALYFHKRSGFEHERELRLYTSGAKEFNDTGSFRDQVPLENGIGIKVDLDVLIEKIYVAPTAPGWFFDLVRKVTRRYEVQKDVVQSEMIKIPVVFDEKLFENLPKPLRHKYSYQE